MNRRLWILGPINTTGLIEHLGTPLLITAATRKVYGILSAIQTAGWTAHLATTPLIGHHRGWHITKGHRMLEDGIHVHFLPSIGIPWVNRLLAAWNYLLLTCRMDRHCDYVLFYNFFPEYIPAALLLYCRGMRPYLDIEDYPDNESRLRSRINRISFSILRKLCHTDPVVAGRNIAQLSGAKRFCVIHGVITDRDLGMTTRPTERIIILFGGTLGPDTGSLLCADAIQILRSDPSKIGRPIEFIITGHGNLEIFYKLEEENQDQVAIRVRAKLTVEEYLSILHTAHIGLCLKMPDSNVGETTFPSKVVELTANGLALVSTAVSDVPELYEDVSVILPRADPQTLAKCLQELSNNPARIAELATRGYERTVHRHGREAVGHRLSSFFLENTSTSP